MSLRIDMVSDIVCPWCFIAKRRLGQALQSLQGPSVVRWHPMQLYPDIPAEGQDSDVFLREKFGTAPAIAAGMERLSNEGALLGIHFDFDRIRRVPNTLDAHRLLASAGPAQQEQLVESLFHGFFEQGLDIADRDVLLALADEAGINPPEAHTILDDERTLEAVVEEQQRLRQLGLSGVPKILLNRRVAISGARDTGALVRAFDYALFGLPNESDQTPVLH